MNILQRKSDVESIQDTWLYCGEEELELAASL